MTRFMRRLPILFFATILAAPAAAEEAGWNWRGTYSLLVENDKFSS
ncbi:MAG: hypothetical protein ACKO1J_07630 [Tagaea sp.]